MFKTGPLYPVNRHAVEDIIINQGGTDSSKTYTILLCLFDIAVFTKPPTEDPVITVFSESVPNIKKGAYRTARNIYDNNPYLQSRIKDWKDGERLVFFKSGWIMEFVGATDEQNAKQGKRQYLFVNEANGVAWPVFWQMAKRTRIRVFIDYNPSAPFWAHEKLIGTTPLSNDLGATVKLIISDHRHNPFLSKKDHDKTENIQDPELWKVYARGATGNLSGIIYSTWRQIPDDKFPWQAPMFGGIDFGYTNDPTAAVRMAKQGNDIYIHELCYETGLSARKIIDMFLREKFTPTIPIYCEHDGDMIRQMRTGYKGSDNKMYNVLAIPARKGPNSINPGITKVKEYNIFYTASSKNIDMERKKYMWVKDPDTGKFLNVPTEADNHLMDAIRYGIYTHFYRSAA